MSTEFDDKELFEGAMADAPAAQAEPEQPQAQAADEGQVRDERGRFAAAQEQPEAQAEEPQPEAQIEEGDKPVPGKRFGEVTRARDEALRRAEEAERRAAEMEARLRTPQPAAAPPQQQAQPEGDLVDALLTDPAGFMAQRDTAMLGAVGEALAKATPEGAKAYDDAFQALATLKQQNPAAFGPAYASIMNTHPLHQARALVDWHRTHQVQQRVGSDPEAFFTRTLEERLTSDPAFAASLVEKLTGQARQAQPAPNGKPLLNLPPSLSRATSAAPAVGSLGDTSDAALFNDALR